MFTIHNTTNQNQLSLVIRISDVPLLQTEVIAIKLQMCLGSLYTLPDADISALVYAGATILVGV